MIFPNFSHVITRLQIYIRKLSFNKFKFNNKFTKMSKKFTAQVDDIINANVSRMRALAGMSSQDLINEMQTPVSKGGNMRVDTGFLRASGQVSFSGMPSGPSRPTDGRDYDWDESIVTVTFSGFELGSPIYFGWTADYAEIREVYDGFRDAALQNWQAINDKNVDIIRRKITT